MSNEEKILEMLGKLQTDMNKMKADIEMLKQNGVKHRQPTKEEQLAFISGMANLLDDEEKDALGKYQEEEEFRKITLYG